MENSKDIKGFCRGCLIKFDDPADLLQYTEKNRRLYVYSTGLQAKRNDTFTFQLCKNCYVNMKLACKFKKQCRSSEKRFRHYLGLKEQGDTTDFCTFLKNNEDSFMYRFPLASGNSTPANPRGKDDDNESTCTSIRNFMTDILRADDIPDTEARIIREVIEEEADVLDDSLDSHWLQDDVSIDNDLHLDVSFSFSPFSTPRSVNNERCYTPPKLKASLQNKVQLNNYMLKEILKENTQTAKVHVKECVTINDDHAKENGNGLTKIEVDENEYGTNENHSTMNDNNCTTNANNGTVNQNHETKYKGGFYTSNFEEFDNAVKNDNDVPKSYEPECTIDKNLEKALNNDNKEYLLKDILGTPRVFPGASAMSTPTISNILFGEKLDLDLENDNTDKQSVVQCVEKYADVEDQVDILEEFFQKTTEEFDLNDKNPLGFDNTEYADPWDHLEIKYNLKDFLCNLCNIKFKSAKAIKIHIAKRHGERIIGPKKKYDRTIGICDYCGKKYHDRAAIKRHIRLHMKPIKPCSCEFCFQEFTSKAKLKIHMTIHTGKPPLKKKRKSKIQKYMCNLCGYSTHKGYSLTVHKKRHNKSYSHTCEQCGKGFCTKSEMDVHARAHSGDKPFPCAFCEKKFSRRDILNKHIKIHTGERPYECTVCKMAFIKADSLKRHMQNSSECLKRQHETIVYQLMSANEVTADYYYVASGEEVTAEHILSEIKDKTSNLSSRENETPNKMFDTNLTMEKTVDDIRDDNG